MRNLLTETEQVVVVGCHEEGHAQQEYSDIRNALCSYLCRMWKASDNSYCYTVNIYTYILIYWPDFSLSIESHASLRVFVVKNGNLLLCQNCKR